MNKSNMYITLIPTQLFIGQEEVLVEKTEFFLQNQFCLTKEKKPECYCNQCRKIKNRQHESIIFIKPDKYYTVNDIDIIFEKINYSLEENEKFFFILQKAQTLNLATANKLLKILEEPGNGYFFILHTDNKNSILPTIVSRCHIKLFNADSEINTQHPLTSFFYENNLNKPIEFEKILKELNLSDNQSLDLLNEMVNFYSKIIINNKKINFSEKEDIYLKQVFELLKQQLKNPPQSGSSKLFWKNMYINFPEKTLF